MLPSMHSDRYKLCFCRDCCINPKYFTITWLGTWNKHQPVMAICLVIIKNDHIMLLSFWNVEGAHTSPQRALMSNDARGAWTVPYGPTTTFSCITLVKRILKRIYKILISLQECDAMELYYSAFSEADTKRGMRNRRRPQDDVYSEVIYSSLT